jgi:SOS-response transcriptional repressor LexA
VSWRERLRTAVRASRRKQSVGWLLEENGYPLSAEQQKKLAEALAFLQVTLVGAAGAQQDARDDPNAVALRKRLDIPRREQLLGAKLVFRVLGTSMADADIAEGDLVFVKPTRDLRGAAGSLVVCRFGASEYLKELELSSGRIRLLSRNDRYAPIEIGTKDDFGLIGVVVGQARQRR